MNGRIEAVNGYKQLVTQQFRAIIKLQKDPIYAIVNSRSSNLIYVPEEAERNVYGK